MRLTAGLGLERQPDGITAHLQADCRINKGECSQLTLYRPRINSRVIKTQLALSQTCGWPAGLVVERDSSEIGRQLHGLAGVSVGFEPPVPQENPAFNLPGWQCPLQPRIGRWRHPVWHICVANAHRRILHRGRQPHLEWHRGLF